MGSRAARRETILARSTCASRTPFTPRTLFKGNLVKFRRSILTQWVQPLNSKGQSLNTKGKSLNSDGPALKFKGSVLKYKG